MRFPKKLISFICILTLLFSCTPTLVYAKTYDPSLVVTYAKSLVGNSYTANSCMRFVKECFQHEYGFTSTACCAYNYSKSYTDSTSMSNIPVGADVFFKGSGTYCHSSYNYAGHIGIYIGDGYMVHAMNGKVRKDKVTDIDAYSSLDFVGWGWHGNKSFANSAPSAPTIKSCTANSSSSITVTWGAVSGATKYEVLIRHKDEDSYKSLTSSCTSTSYTAKNLKAGNLYYFKIRAINDAGTSAKSDCYRKYTMLSTPAAPTVVTDSDTQLTITWSKVTNAKKYKIERRRGDESKYTEIKTVTGTSYTDTGLKPNSKYWYRITAVAEVSEGLKDNYKTQPVYSDVSEVGHKWTAYSRPSNTVDADNTDRLTLSWKKSYGGYTYKIYRMDYSTTKPIATTTSTTYTDKGLTSGVIYQYKIETVVTDTGAHCVSSDWFYAASKVAKAVTATPASASSVKIEWSSLLTGGKNLIYRVGRKESSTDDYEFIKTTTGTSYTDTGLTAGKEYTYYVQVRDSSDNYITSIWGKTVTITLPTGVTLNKTSAEITEGSKLTLSAAISPTNANVSKTLTWSSGNTSVATVTSKGVVTAVSEGTAVITVKTANSKTATCTVTVKAKECSHTYSEWTVDTEAACETDGIKSRTCTKCGETETDIISATGHSYGEWIVEAEATCIEEGSKYRECSVCGETETEIIEALSETGEHSFGEWITEAEASCINEGSEYRECSVCGETEVNVIEAIDHDYVLTEQIDPTLDEPGSRTYTCSNCGDSYTESYIMVVEEGTIKVGSAAPMPGDTFTVPVTISDNPGISGFSFTINYDGNVMQPTSITAGELVTSGFFTSNLEQGIPAEDLDVVGISWSDSANIVDDGTLFYITFETENIASGEYEITLDYNQGDICAFTDTTLEAVMPDIIGGTVTLADIIRGDVNLDRSVDSFDVILLLRYLSHWSITLTEEQTEAADVFSDGVLNIMDTARLSQILIGYKTSSDTSAVSLASNVNTSAVSLYSLSSDSTSDTQITVESVDGTAGEYISVPVTIENNTGIAALSLTVDYDSNYLTPVSITADDILQDGQFISNIEESEDVSDLEYITVVWNDSENMTEDGTLFTLEFLVNETAEVGQELTVEINCDDSMACDQDLNETDVSVVQGSINIPEYDENLISFNESIQHGVYITVDGETECEDIPNDESFYLGVYIEYIDADLIPATLVIAEYDSDGRLIGTVFEDITDTMLDEEVYISQPETEIDKIKVYIWDSPSGMIPLSDVIEIS